MRYVLLQPTELAAPLRRTPERDKRLADWLTSELVDATSARFQQDVWMQEDLRLYEAHPKQPIRNTPVEGMPAIEVPLIAIMVDDLYARFIDIVFAPQPVLTARAVKEDDTEQVEDARVTQRFVEWGSNNEFMARAAGDHVFLDTVKLGWGVFYIGWRNKINKTSLRRVTDVGAIVMPVPNEDFFARGGLAYDIQSTPWVAMRSWLLPGELAEYGAKSVSDAQRWDTAKAIPVSNCDWVRSKREQLAGTTPNRAAAERYEIFTAHCYFDYDEDGTDENLIAIIDRTSHNLMWLAYNEQEKRPYEVCAFQIRAHSLGGIGVARMLAPLQMELTEQHFDAMVNSKLANTRMWAGPPGLVKEGHNMRIWPGKYLGTTEPDAPREIKLSDTYPSAYRNEAAIAALAQQRIGSDLSSPRPSQVLQSRTPATTALTFNEQSNRRFTPAFNSMRSAFAGAHWQCLLRYRERLQAGDRKAEANIVRVLGEEDGQRLVALLQSPHFEDRVTVQTSAASVNANKEADRNAWIQLMNVLGPYYIRLMELAQVIAQPEAPDELKKLATDIVAAAGEAMKRMVRTFDQVSDPSTLVVELETAVDENVDAPPDAITALLSLIGGGGNGQAPGMPGLPEPVPVAL